MFCLVAITYTSPNISVAASKRVPREREKKEERVQGVLNLKYIYICFVLFCFDILKFFVVFFFYVQNWLRC